MSLELLLIDGLLVAVGIEGLGLRSLTLLLQDLSLVLSAVDLPALVAGALGELVGEVVASPGGADLGVLGLALLHLLKLEDLLGSSDDGLGVEGHHAVLEFALVDHPVELHGVGALTTAVVSGLGLLGVSALAVSNQAVLVSLAGEVEGPVLALGDVLGLHHLVVFLALAPLGLQHAVLVLSDHVLGQLGDVVGVLALALDPLLHGGPVVLVSVLTGLLVAIPEPRVPPAVLLAVRLVGLLGLLHLDGGNQGLLEVDRPLGLLGGHGDSLELTLLGGELHRGLQVLLVLPGQRSPVPDLHISPVLGLRAAQFLVEGSVLDVLHHHLVGVLGGGLHDHLTLDSHPGEGGVNLGDPSEDPAGVSVDILLPRAEPLARAG